MATTEDTIRRMQQLAMPRTAYVVLTYTGFILGVYMDEKAAHFRARMHTTQTSEACRVSAEPVIRPE